VFVVLMAPALFLMGVGPLARWKQASVPELATRLKWAFAVSVVTALLLPLTMGKWIPLASFGFLLALWIVASSVTTLLSRLKQTPGATVGAKLRAQSRSYYGMLLAHVGVAVFVMGVTMVKSYEVEKDVKLAIGETVELGGYAFRFDAISEVQGPNYRAVRGTMTVTRDASAVGMMYPEKRIYNVQKNAMTEAAINTGFTRDLYVSLGEPVGDNAWVVRVQVKPFVDWIWGGCVLMALGGLLAVLDRRYRVAARVREQAITPAGAAAAG
jgi:cytochrome c-type biogenesis protein CcmF